MAPGRKAESRPAEANVNPAQVPVYRAPRATIGAAYAAAPTAGLVQSGVPVCASNARKIPLPPSPM